MPFEELEHTADVLMRITADTPEELFLESARAMFSIMFCNRGNTGIRHSFSTESDSPDSLLREFLSELLYLSEVNSTVFSDVSLTISGNTLQAEASGELFDQKKHAGGTEIKGISYFGLNIKKEGKQYQVEILFDI